MAKNKKKCAGKKKTSAAKKPEFSVKEIEANNQIYAARQKMYDKYGYNNEKERLYIIAKAMPLKGKILEAGTGKGYLALEIAKKGYALTTYDIDRKIQRIAKMNLAYAGVLGRAKFVIEKKDKLSFKDKSFDVIFCVNTLHHLEKSQTVLDEFLRVVSDTGKIILSDFTGKTFKIMDRVHKSEGGTHEVIGWSMDEAHDYIKNKGCKIKDTADAYQRVFIIQREKN